MLFSLYAASQALLLSPLNAAHSTRMASPMMQMQTERPSQVASFMDDIAPTNLAIADGITVQGGSLRTWAYRSSVVEEVQVIIGTPGRPMDAEVDLWHGPDNTPVKMRVYVEDGSTRPFETVIQTPRGPNTVAIRNIGALEFPLVADVNAREVQSPSAECVDRLETIQGGALKTYPFEPNVDTVQVLIETDGRPLNARIELLQGPNNNKQVIELYTEDGSDRPFFCTLHAPGSGNVVRIVNTAPVEFPMSAAVVAGRINMEVSTLEPVLGGD